MPQPETASLVHKLVVWEKTGTDEYSRPTVTAPAQLSCRWEDRKAWPRGPFDATVEWDAEVTTCRALTVGSVVRRGTLADLPAGTDFPPGGESLYRVLSCDVVPDVRARATSYELKLVRFGDGLPART